MMMSDFKSKDIFLAKNVEIDEFTDKTEYIKNLLKAAQYIENVVKVKQKKVFVYCNSGICRAPTVIMAYLSYCK
jgi:protein-tyrosine phosphatase